jgi:hypothetical protein
MSGKSEKNDSGRDKNFAEIQGCSYSVLNSSIFVNGFLPYLTPGYINQIKGILRNEG